MSPLQGPGLPSGGAQASAASARLALSRPVMPWIDIRAVGQHVHLDVIEAGAFHVQANEARVSVAIKSPPNGNGLRREAAVRETHDERGSRTQRPRDIPEDLDRALQVLDADTAQHCV
ncbi:hypothetical protein [Lichenihabitans psoromatis]|uniref:hypothetical protein n=1 Tax=Lichenihabitans psoromatis TaxID=2528642 RepID=UPI001FE0EA37|nr:hypothetical protein [Lichenihabitans psoromatis]